MLIAKYPTTAFYRVAKRHLFLVPSKWRFSRCDRKKRCRSLWRCEVLPESSLGPQRQKRSWQECQPTTLQACHAKSSKFQWLAKKVRLLIDFEKILEKLKTGNYTSIVAHAINNNLFKLGIHYINNINRRQVSIISTRCRWWEICAGPDALPSTCTNLQAIQVRKPWKIGDETGTTVDSKQSQTTTRDGAKTLVNNGINWINYLPTSTGARFMKHQQYGNYGLARGWLHLQ